MEGELSSINYADMQKIKSGSQLKPKVSSLPKSLKHKSKNFWIDSKRYLNRTSALDKKTEALAYLAVLAALGMESGVPFHVHLAKQGGASREEIISAILVGLPAAGHNVTQVLPAALAAYDAE